MLCLGVAAAMIAAFVPVSGGEEEIAGIAWMTDLDAANTKAAREGRPVLVVFR